MILIWVVAGLALANVLLCGLLLWAGSRWFRTPRGSFGRSLLVAALVGVFPPLVQTAGLLFHLTDVAAIAAFLGAVLAVILLSWAVIRVAFGASWERTVALWGVAFMPSIALVALLLLTVIEPRVMEGYIVPSHSMAPTLLGPHRLGECPGGEGVASVPVHPDTGEVLGSNPLGICHDDRAPVTLRILDEQVRPADRFVADKTVEPRRWDLVVFRSPEDPNQLAVKRLVGMPGERIEIREGGAWIDGEPLAPPPELPGLRYERLIDLSGRPPGEVALGEGQVYLLGDFTDRSVDSRIWGPVPTSDLVGVARAIYWPPDRWRLLP